MRIAADGNMVSLWLRPRPDPMDETGAANLISAQEKGPDVAASKPF
jgi:hypothetical protein